MNWNFILGLVAGTSLITAVRWIRDYRSRKKSQLLVGDLDSFFFSPHQLTLQCLRNKAGLHLCSVLACPVCNLRRFISLIKNTKTHIDVCVFLITSEALAQALINLSSKGVFVRIIVDKEMSVQAQNSKVCIFAKHHIPLKIVTSGEMMHNKFVIIDQKVVVTGSFNWTKQGTFSNYENAVVIRNEKVVNKFLNYFQDIWVLPDKKN